MNIICEHTYHSLIPKCPLEPADIPLDSPGGELECIGQIQSKVTHNGKTYPLKAYVIQGRTANNLQTIVCGHEAGEERRRNRE